MFGALLNGSTLVVVSKETARDPHAFRLLLKRTRHCTQSDPDSFLRPDA